MRSVAIVSAVAFLLDRISKIIMINNVFKIESLNIYSHTTPVVVIDKILNFKYVGNDGVAWGFLAIGKWWLVVLCAVILILIGFIIYKTKPQNLLEKISYGMVIGGALGNVYDRIAHGFVIDFIDVQFMEYPTFNVADCFVVVGAILLCICVLFFDKKEDEVGKI